MHENELVAQQEEKNKIVDGFDKNNLSQLIKLERIREQSSKISTAQTDFTLKISQSFFETKGKLIPPVAGEITQRFGLMEDQKHGVKLRFKGVYLETKPGTEVKSVFNGEVLFSDMLPGLGYTLILSHGDHYYTVYGNNSEVAVKRGEKVKTGEVIAKVGTRWHQWGPGSYFEIRHFSDLIDPNEWFQGRAL